MVPFLRVGFGMAEVSVACNLKSAMFNKLRFRVKMGRYRLNERGLRLYDPLPVRAPYLYEPPVLVQ